MGLAMRPSRMALNGAILVKSQTAKGTGWVKGGPHTLQVRRGQVTAGG